MTITLSQIQQGAAAAVPLPVSQGGTSATSAAAALASLGAQPAGNYATGGGTATGTNTGDQILPTLGSLGGQPLDADLTAIAALAGTFGLLKKTAADTWTLDTTAYTTNTGIVTGVTGTAPIVSSGGTAPAISISAATTGAAGSMSAADKSKLDGIAESANNYTHPVNHPPSIITQDASNRFVTDTEKATWSAKQDSLESGTNIKTINSASLLGSGNITIGGLTYLSEVRNNSAPNATIPVHGITPTSSETDIDLLLEPKGTGAIIAQVPTDTTVGGNKRGINAVDLQLWRSAADQVASGSMATALGGGNRAYGSYSLAVGAANAAATYCVALGQSNSATGTNCVVIGKSNSSNSSLTSVTLGESNTVSGGYAAAIGKSNSTYGYGSVSLGLYANDNYVAGRLVFGTSPISATGGKNQTSVFVMGILSTDAGQWTLKSTTSAVSSTNTFTLRNDSAAYIEGRVVGKVVGSASAVGFNFACLVHRGVNASQTTFIGTPSVTRTFSNATTSALNITVSTNTSNGGLTVLVDGIAATSINWTCVLYSSEVL